MSVRKAPWILLIVLAIGLTPWPQAMAPPPQSQTVHIIDTHDDGFVTESGIGIDSSLVHILDPGMDITAFLVFRQISIDFWEPLTNATLRLRTANTLAYDADSSVTVYGIKLSDLQSQGWLGPTFIMSTPLTTAHVDVNTSQFYGQAWHDIDVTDIIEELIRNIHWDGEGAPGGWAGDDIGFIILGAQDNTRYFHDYLGNPNYSADLVIHWNHAPTPPSAQAPGPYDTWTWEYENTSDLGPDIWKVTDYGDPEFQAFSIELVTLHGWYINNTKGPGNELEWSTTAFSHSESGAMDPILCLDPWTLILGQNTSLKLFWSDDEFQTFQMVQPNDQYNLAPWAGRMGSLVIDQLNERTIHMVWTSPTPGHVGVFNVIYTNFTLNPDTGVITWAPSYTNLTQIAQTQLYPVIYCELDGTLHVAYGGEQGTNDDQIWYRRRLINGTWLAQVRLSGSDVLGFPHSRPDVVANEATGVAMVVWDYDGTDTYWNVVFPNNTVGAVDRLANTGRKPSMVNDRDNDVAHLVYDTGGGNPQVRYQTRAIDNTTAWSATGAVSPGAEKHMIADIGLDPVNRSVHVIWYNDWNLWVAGNWWLLGGAPVAGKTRITNSQGGYNYIEEETSRNVGDQVFFTAWPNGTLQDGPFDTLEDAEIGIETVIGPDPEDPDPVTDEWPQTGPFTRFRTRAYFFIVGFACIWGPIWFFAWKRPSGYYILGGLLVMLIGVGLLIHVATI